MTFEQLLNTAEKGFTVKASGAENSPNFNIFTGDTPVFTHRKNVEEKVEEKDSQIKEVKSTIVSESVNKNYDSPSGFGWGGDSDITGDRVKENVVKAGDKDERLYILGEKMGDGPEKIVYIQNECNCSGKHKKSFGNSNMVTVVNKDTTLTGEEGVIILNSKTSLNITLPVISHKNEKGINKSADSIVIKSLYNNVTHKIISSKGDKIGETNNIRLLGGQARTFYGTNSNWYPV